MEFAAAILAGYLLLGFQKVAQDLRADPVERPGWARRPTFGMAFVVGLLWWWPMFRNTRLTAHRLARALLGVSTQLAVISSFIWAWYAAWGLVLSNTAARVIAAAVSLAALAPFLGPVFAVYSAMVGLLVMLPIGLLIDLVLSKSEQPAGGTEETSRSKLQNSPPMQLAQDDDEQLGHEVNLDDELVEGETETFAEKEKRLITELDALELMARASQPWTGASALDERHSGNSAVLEKDVAPRFNPTDLGVVLATIVTTVNGQEAKDPTTLWGAIGRAEARISPAACHFELTALRMAAVTAAIKDVIADGLEFPDDVLVSYEDELLAAFGHAPFTKLLVDLGAAADADGVLALARSRKRVYLEACKSAPVERQARMFVTFEERCKVEPGALGLAIPSEFDHLRELAEKILRGSLQPGAERR